VILVLNGPNLSRLGTREVIIYGTATYADLVQVCQDTAAELGLDVDVRQTDYEGEMLGWLHEAADGAVDGVVLNGGAWTHYSYALRDAVANATGVGVPVIEVHISQPAAREEFRHLSVVAPVANGSITGLGIDGYRLALRALAGRALAARRGDGKR
jgi:3-dehydroquinate dehydratase-2